MSQTLKTVCIEGEAEVRIKVNMTDSWFALYLNGILHEVRHSSSVAAILDERADYNKPQRPLREDSAIWAEETRALFAASMIPGQKLCIEIRSFSNFACVLINVTHPPYDFDTV